MKYFIGYLLQGEVAEWHANTARKIADKFNTWKIYEKLPPHITIFYPEGVEDITEVRNYIAGWVKNNKIPGNLYVSGFDRFEDRVIFAKIDADDSVNKAVEDLRTNIKNVSGVTEEDFPIWHPHATLAYKLTPMEIENIWDFTLSLDKPNFTIPFDNVTIFKFIGDKKWVVEESFKINS
jgi:2'-5' RNA ligase